MKRVEFYYDLVSSYSYLAYGRVKRVCKEHGAELALRPMLLGAVHKAVERGDFSAPAFFVGGQPSRKADGPGDFRVVRPPGAGCVIRSRPGLR